MKDLRWRVVYLESENYNKREIAKLLSISIPTVHYILKTFSKWGCVVNPFKEVSGRKKKFSRIELQILQQLVKEKVDWYLDELLVEMENQTGKTVSVFTTADSTDYRLASTATLEFKEKRQPPENEISVFVDPTKTYQEFLGVGAALTDASAETFAKLPKDKQQEFLKAYFDKEKGIAYSIARTNIHSCDFSSGTYTYVTDGDKELKSFNVDHDKKYRIPFIKEAIKAARGKLTLYGSPWSPPAWMKDNNDILHGGKLKPEFNQSWANYYAKFIKAYEKEGIPVWGISIQNEPMATQKWESCIYTADEEKDFLKNLLLSKRFTSLALGLTNKPSLHLGFDQWIPPLNWPKSVKTKVPAAKSQKPEATKKSH
jgi:transposase